MFIKPKLIYILSIFFFIAFACSDDNEEATNNPNIFDLVIEDENLPESGFTFLLTGDDIVSESQYFIVNGENLSSEIIIETTDDFEVSVNDIDFSNSVIISSEVSNIPTKIYVRFKPDSTVYRDILGSLSISNSLTDTISIPITGKAIINGVINFLTFDKERVAFGGGYSQVSKKTFNLLDDLSNIKTIKMYVKLTCPDEGCDEWDVFANVKIKDVQSDEYYELGRFITPYWNDNSQLPRGFEFDVTDFKSILTGEVELRIRTECWNARGYEVSVNFDYIQGTPDFPYYAISRVLNYDNGSASGVPYGEEHDKDLTKVITIPENTETTHLRTFINGWGEATPADEGGRRCAEWCYRTHKIMINNTDTFEHYLGPLGCADNIVNNQSPGNWTPDRAGWCPGMVIPTRINEFSSSMAGNSFNFEYKFEDWINDESKDAYYPISTYVVVKSNTEITRPIVID